MVAAHKIRHPRFARLASKMGRAAPPCMADDADWRAADSWLDEADVPESDASLHAAPMPDFTRNRPPLSKLVSQLLLLQLMSSALKLATFALH